MEGFEDLKISIFPGVNDIPIAPTTTTGSNISHIHQQFNNLIDSVVTGNQELQDSIYYNYDYFYDYCSSNKGFINANSTTISNNRAYHDNVTGNIQTNLAEVTGRVDNLETALLPQSVYEFDNVSLSPDGNNNYKYDIAIPITGKLLYILLDNTFDGNNNTFRVNNAGIFVGTGASSDSNYIYAYDVGIYDQNVTQGDTLTLTSTNNDTAITKIKIKILPSEASGGVDQGQIDTLTERINQLENTIAVIQNTLAGDTSEFIFDNVSFTNDSLYENYLITVPKTGTLTKIEFNDVNQLSEIYIEYSGSDQTTSENIGSDPNYPYILDFDPTISVTENLQLRIYTEYEEPTLTSIKLTIV